MTQTRLLHQQVRSLFNSDLMFEKIPELDLQLLLLQVPQEQNFSSSQVEAIWANMPYWAFVWSSGRALANYVTAHPHLVQGKVIADFGAGSGIVALAALKAGAKQAWVVDIDKAALLACHENAKANGVTVYGASSLDELGPVDLILVGDVLYDPRNHGLAKALFLQEKPVIWAESHAQTKLSQYGPVASLASETIPNIGGFDEHRQIHIYHHKI